METGGLLPWNQMGARQKRSRNDGRHNTHSVGGETPGCISTRSRPGRGLRHVLHARLLWCFAGKATQSGWSSTCSHSPLTGGRGYRSTTTKANGSQRTQGYPRGLHCRQYCFYSFSDLLETFRSARGGIIGLGFVDDTNLIAWGPTATDNCRRLEDAHNACTEWA